MEISRKTDYALRMLAELVRGSQEVISVRAAAENNDVPYSFARSIQHDLVLAHIVESSRGSHGGMRLAVDPHDVTMLEVVEAVQGPICLATCDVAGEDGGPCPRRESCGFNPLWSGARELLCRYFSSVTLYEVVMEGKVPSLKDVHFSKPSADVADDNQTR